MITVLAWVLGAFAASGLFIGCAYALEAAREWWMKSRGGWNR